MKKRSTTRGLSVSGVTTELEYNRIIRVENNSMKFPTSEKVITGIGTSRKPTQTLSQFTPR